MSRAHPVSLGLHYANSINSNFQFHWMVLSREFTFRQYIRPTFSNYILRTQKSHKHATDLETRVDYFALPGRRCENLNFCLFPKHIVRVRVHLAHFWKIRLFLALFECSST